MILKHLSSLKHREIDLKYSTFMLMYGKHQHNILIILKKSSRKCQKNLKIKSKVLHTKGIKNKVPHVPFVNNVKKKIND